MYIIFNIELRVRLEVQFIKYYVTGIIIIIKL